VDLLLKDLLMFAFSRGPKTLQRWFRAGVVPNGYRTKGGAKRGGGYRIKAPAGVTRRHIVLWRELMKREACDFGRFKKPITIWVCDHAGHQFPPAFVQWCIRAEEQIGDYQADHSRGRRWPVAVEGVRRKRKIRGKADESNASVMQAQTPA
jgi:hypothetical protein